MSSTKSSAGANQKKIAALFHLAGRKTVVALALAGLLLMSTSAMATQFVFSYSGDNISGSGELTAHDIGGGSYLATGGSATVKSNGSDLGSFSLIANTSAPSSDVFTIHYSWLDTNISYNDLVSFPQLSLDVNGLLFSNGADQINIYKNDGSGLYSADLYTSQQYNWNLNGDDVAFTLTEVTAPVPEPGTIMLFALGMFGLAVYGKRRSFNAAA